jgi:NAD(P)-dependent dehydrogenase (short-subunit alcohol dehydrogenase family)
MLAEFKSIAVWSFSIVVAGAVSWFSVLPVAKPVVWVGAVVVPAVVTRVLTSPGNRVQDKLLRRDLTGKVAIITGCAGGLGLEHAVQLVKQNVTLVTACRSVKRNEEAAKLIRERVAADRKGTSQATAQIVTRFALDLEDLSSARKFSADFLGSGMPLDFLVMNGGLSDFGRAKFAKGNPELDFTLTVNNLSHLVLTEALEEKMKTCNTRVVSLSSVAHTFVLNEVTPASMREAVLKTHRDPAAMLRVCKKRYPTDVYSLAKYINVCHAHYLASKGIEAVSLHPGVVATNFFSCAFPGSTFITRYVFPFMLFKKSEEGAWVQITATLCDASAIAPRAAPAGGGKITKLAPYMCDSRVAWGELVYAAQNPAVVEAAIDACLEIIKKN